MKKVTFFLILGICCVIIYTQLTIFVIQPIGAIPEGKTLIILRMNNTKFLDSADAMCERMQGGVNLLCRGMILGDIAKRGKILIRLPYSERLYTLTIGGKKYMR